MLPVSRLISESYVMKTRNHAVVSKTGDEQAVDGHGRPLNIRCGLWGARCLLAAAWLLSAVGVQAQTYQNTNNGFWSLAASWNGSIPTNGGNTDYVISFNNSRAIFSTNNLGAGGLSNFFLNQLAFNSNYNVYLTTASQANSVSNFVFAWSSLSGDPQINQNGWATNAIAANLIIATNLWLGGTSTPSAVTGSILIFSNTISGAGGLIMTGKYTTVLMGANNYTGGTILSNGVIRLGNNNALGAPGGTIVATVGSGGSLDLNGYWLSAAYNTKTLVISGFGIGPDIGVVFNSSTNMNNVGLANVLLAGDAAIGGAANGNVGRMDITGVLNGGGFTLYKVGSNETWFASSGTLTNTPSVVITNGSFGMQNNIALAGAGATVFTVQTNGALRTYGNLTSTNAIILNGGRVWQSGGGAADIGSTWNSPVTLNGVSNRFDTTGGALTMGGNITGAGDLSKIGPYQLTLRGANNYAGGTFVSDGMLLFTSTNAISTTGKILVSAISAGVALDSNTVASELLPYIRQDSAGAVALRAGSVNENLDFTTGGGYTNLSLGAASSMTYGGTYTPFQSGGINYYRLAAYSNVVFTFTNVISDDVNGGSQSRLYINVINGATAQNQGGVVLITNANTYTGQTILAASGAVLQISHGLALGDISGGTIVSNNAQLRITNNITINEPLTLNGDGFPIYSGALRSWGTNTLAGLITGSGSVAAGSGVLTVSGGITNVGSLRVSGGAIMIITNKPVTAVGSTMGARIPRRPSVVTDGCEENQPVARLALSPAW